MTKLRGLLKSILNSPANGRQSTVHTLESVSFAQTSAISFIHSIESVWFLFLQGIDLFWENKEKMWMCENKSQFSSTNNSYTKDHQSPLKIPLQLAEKIIFHDVAFSTKWNVLFCFVIAVKEMAFIARIEKFHVRK